jgi:hypothetical protein
MAFNVELVQLVAGSANQQAFGEILRLDGGSRARDPLNRRQGTAAHPISSSGSQDQQERACKQGCPSKTAEHLHELIDRDSNLHYAKRYRSREDANGFAAPHQGFKPAMFRQTRCIRHSAPTLRSGGLIEPSATVICDPETRPCRCKCSVFDQLV